MEQAQLQLVNTNIASYFGHMGTRADKLMHIDTNLECSTMVTSYFK